MFHKAQLKLSMSSNHHRVPTNEDPSEDGAALIQIETTEEKRVKAPNVVLEETKEERKHKRLQKKKQEKKIIKVTKTLVTMTTPIDVLVL